MYEIEFYRDKNGCSDIVDFLDSLQEKSKSSKTARINRTKILSHIAALSAYGVRVGKPFVKHIEGDIWELRPLDNRIFFFYWKDGRYVLLHYFLKKTQKTPEKEILIAKNRMVDFLERHDTNEKRS